MPNEGRDGRNVALNLTSVHGVLDCPKKNQAITYPACLITSTTVLCYCVLHVSIHVMTLNGVTAFNNTVSTTYK